MKHITMTTKMQDKKCLQADMVQLKGAVKDVQCQQSNIFTNSSSIITSHYSKSWYCCFQHVCLCVNESKSGSGDVCDADNHTMIAIF